MNNWSVTEGVLQDELISHQNPESVEIFWACEAKTGFTLNAKIYTGRRSGEPVEHDLAKKLLWNSYSHFSIPVTT